MIIYSESYHVEFNIEEKWREWVKSTFIPKICETKIFLKVIFMKVISHTDETGNTYSIQYYTKDQATLTDFHNHHAQLLSQLLFAKFGTQVLCFKTELEILEIFEF